ncbi:MAG: hypothetical protein WCJ33_04220 [Pseudomonadota bacterium]
MEQTAAASNEANTLPADVGSGGADSAGGSEMEDSSGADSAGGSEMEDSSGANNLKLISFVAKLKKLSKKVFLERAVESFLNLEEDVVRLKVICNGEKNFEKEVALLLSLNTKSLTDTHRANFGNMLEKNFMQKLAEEEAGNVCVFILFFFVLSFFTLWRIQLVMPIVLVMARWWALLINLEQFLMVVVL